MNAEVFDVLTKWKKQVSGDFVFPGKEGKRLDNVKKSWAGLLKLAKRLNNQQMNRNQIPRRTLPGASP